jgi:hypothetical protein
LHTKMLVLAMKFSRNAGETSSHQEGRADVPANGDGLRSFTTEDRTGTGDSSAVSANERYWHQTSASTGCPDSTRNKRP